mmetsp:Transcript_61730/g.134988  ORF Transcript_61730/g.134988 Transcript_61730/m.134988 type:complete len:95 (-) Transcript_61730:179-463(-)
MERPLPEWGPKTRPWASPGTCSPTPPHTVPRRRGADDDLLSGPSKKALVDRLLQERVCLAALYLSYTSVFVWECQFCLCCLVWCIEPAMEALYL